MRLLGHLCIFFRSKNDLREAFAIAQINEHDAAMIPAHRDPAGQFNLAVDIGFTQFVAVMSAVAHAGKCRRSF